MKFDGHLYYSYLEKCSESVLQTVYDVKFVHKLLHSGLPLTTQPCGAELIYSNRREEFDSYVLSVFSTNCSLILLTPWSGQIIIFQTVKERHTLHDLKSVDDK